MRFISAESKSKLRIFLFSLPNIYDIFIICCSQFKAIPKGILKIKSPNSFAGYTDNNIKCIK